MTGLQDAIDAVRLLTVVFGRRMGENRNNLKEMRFRLDIRQASFSVTHRHWLMLSGKVDCSLSGMLSEPK